MSFTDAIRTCFGKYVTFSGRASRPEYWYFVLFVVLGGAVAGILDGQLFGAASIETGPGSVSAQANGPITSLFSLATILPVSPPPGGACTTPGGPGFTFCTR